VSATVEERIYATYLDFFEKGERKRRWSVFDDVDWGALADEKPDSDRGLTAETYCGIEMLLPDYVSQGIHLVRRDVGQTWFIATWGYEEAKHGLALREYLTRTGLRTNEELLDFQSQIIERAWTIPFDTPRRMIAYGFLQESTTLLSYKKERAAAIAADLRVLASIYAWIGRDEAAHADFYARLFRIQLENDPDGAIDDLVHVFRHFQMPGRTQLPDFEARAIRMAEVGLNRQSFIAEVWLPALRRLGLSRKDVSRALRRQRQDGDGRAAGGTSVPADR